MLLTIGIGLAVAGLGALIVLRLTDRSTPKPTAPRTKIIAAVLTSVAVRSGGFAAISLAIVYAFVYALLPDYFLRVFHASVFWPVTLGLVTVAVVRTFGKGGNQLAAAIVVLILIATGKEFWNSRTIEATSSEEQATQANTPDSGAPSKAPRAERDFFATVPADGSWSRWVDTKQQPARWTASTNVIVSLDNGKTYPSSADIPGPFRYLRFRSVKPYEGSAVRYTSKVDVSYAPDGTVPEPSHVEWFPGDDSTKVGANAGLLIFSGDHIEETIKDVNTSGHHVELVAVEGAGLLEMIDDRGGRHSVYLSELPAVNSEQWFRTTKSLKLLGHSSTAERMVVRVMYPANP